MSTTIDSRVVEMRFDNKQFESNVQTSIGTIDRLQQKLNLTGAAKGFENVSAAAKSVDMSPLSSAVETVGLKFSAMYTMADQALRNITNSVMNTGKRMLSALTVDPITTGFSEYETKINAVQTIMSNTASKGKTMEDVTKVLNDLNAYADKTIYNFAEMTRNIGTFTAAGVGLEESATAIEGIANLAAMSGSNSQQASTAMYQLSQAMAAGTVKLMDWNSVVNAGMGGQLFQDALKETARAHGVAVDDLIEKNGSFRESLQDGWITTEILTETLAKMTKSGAAEYLAKLTGVEESQITAAQKLVANNKDGSASYEELAEKLAATGKISKEKAIDILKMADNAEDAATKVKTFTQLWDTLKESAQSGWSQTWEILVGDFEEAKETLTEFSNVIGDVINKSAEARNKLLQGWKDAGGRAMLVESLFNVFEGIASVAKPIQEAFREIFPPTTVDQLMGITEAIKNFTEKLKLSDRASENLKRTFKGVFAFFDILKQAFVAVVKAISPLFGTVDDLGGGILGFTAKLGDGIVKLNNFIRSSGAFNDIAQTVAKVIGLIVKGLGKLISVLKSNFISPGIEFLRDIFEAIGAKMSKVGEAANDMKSGVTGAVDSIGSALSGSSFFQIIQTLWKTLVTIGSGAAKIFGSLANGLINIINNANIENFFDILSGFITGGLGIGLINFINGLSEPFAGLSGTFETITGILDGVRGSIESYQTQLKAGTLIKIASAIAILVASIFVLSTIDSEKMFTAIAGITTLFAELMGSMAIFGKISGNLGGVFKACTTMISISIAVLLLASALKTIGNLEWDQMVVGLLGVAGLTATLVGVAKILGKEEKTIINGAFQMVVFAVAVKILASACEDLAYLSVGELTKGLIGVGALLAGISIFLNKAQFNAQSLAAMTGIVAMATAIKILASVCNTFAEMDTKSIIKGLGGVAVLLGEIILFSKYISAPGGLFGTSMALIAIGVAMKILASAMKDIASMSVVGLIKSLRGMAVALTTLTVALRLMPTNMGWIGAGLLAVSTAMLILSNALVKLGNMSVGSVVKSLITFGGALLILSLGLIAMKNTITGSAAMLVAAVAISMLTPALAKLGNMSVGSIAKSLIVLAGAFTVIGLAGYFLGPLVPTIISLAGAFALIGLSVLAIGAGLIAAGAGLSAIAVGITALATSLIAAKTVIPMVIAGIVVGLIKGIGEGIIALCGIIIDGVPAIGEAIKVLVLTMADVLIECFPVIKTVLMKMLIGLLEALVEYAPKIVDLVFDFLISIFDGISAKLPDLIESAVGVFTSFFQGIVNALTNIDLGTLGDGLAGVAKLTALMIALGVVASMIPSAMVGVLGMGMVIAELAVVLAAIGALAQIPGLSWLISEGGDFLGVIGAAIGQFIGGIAGGIAQGFASSLPDIGSDLSEFMKNLTPFIEGASMIDSSVLDGVKTLVAVILALTGASIIENLTSWITGGSSLSDFGKELATFGEDMKKYADSVSGIDVAAVEASANAAKALSQVAANLPNSGGLAGWLLGENDMSEFGGQLESFGSGLKKYSESVAGIDTAAVESSAVAAKSLAEMTSHIPNNGGLMSWITGENSVSRFGDDLVNLGKGIKGFANEIVGINPENITAAASAAKALAEMTSYIPNQGGMVAWFTGESSISRFSAELVTLGKGIKGFSDKIVDINPENLTAAANAAKAIAEMTSYIPNQGGVVAWFTGESSMSRFTVEMVMLGAGLKSFAMSVADIKPENVTAAAGAAKAIAEMTSYIPNQGGIVAWFTGENSLSKFASQLPALGKGLKGFSDSVADINPENIASAANAAKALAEMTAVIPSEGGIKAWFTGKTSISNFADKLPTLGDGLKGFSDSVADIKPENVTAAANAAKALGEMTSVIPKNTDKIIKFGTNIVTFGGSLSSYFSKTGGITTEAISASNEAVSSVKKLTDMNSGNIKSVAKAIDDAVDSIKKMAKIPKDSTKEFTKALENLGKASADSLVEAFNEIESDMKKVGKVAMEAFIDGIKDKTSSAKKACESLSKDSAKSAGSAKSAFTNAGRDLVIGFASGISTNTYRATAKARAMAKAAAKAAEEELDINSPSKVFRAMGYSVPEGFAGGIDKMSNLVSIASVGMADSAIDNVNSAISSIAEIVSSDIDTEPTIRPVIDLTNVRSGAKEIGSMFGSSSVGVLANVGSISSMMNHRSQNGDNSEVVSAIRDLRKDFDKLGNTTYSINGITYDDGTNMANAIATIVREARMERRR